MTQTNLERFIIGPLATIALTIVYHLTALHYNWTFTVGAIWVAMVIGAFIGGFRSSLIAAVWAGIYSYLVMPTDTDLWIQRVVWGFCLAGAVGIMRRRQRIRDEIINQQPDNTKVSQALTIVRTLKIELSQNDWAITQLTIAESNLGNYLALLSGYNHLRDEIEQVEKWYALPGNLERWQEWNVKR